MKVKTVTTFLFSTIFATVVVLLLQYSMLPPLPGKRAVMDQAELMNENPFRLPTDDQIFRMREDERKDKEHSKDFNMSLKVWERSKKEVLSASERLREIVGRLVLHHHHDHAYVHTSVDSYVI